MNHKITQNPQNESTRLTDALIWMDISYLDSSTGYRESLQTPDETRCRKSTFAAEKKNAVKYGLVVVMLLIAIAGLGMVWFCLK